MFGLLAAGVLGPGQPTVYELADGLKALTLVFMQRVGPQFRVLEPELTGATRDGVWDAWLAEDGWMGAALQARGDGGAA
jgi:hypothetical protein